MKGFKKFIVVITLEVIMGSDYSAVLKCESQPTANSTRLLHLQQVIGLGLGLGLKPPPPYNK